MHCNSGHEVLDRRVTVLGPITSERAGSPARQVAGGIVELSGCDGATLVFRLNVGASLDFGGSA